MPLNKTQLQILQALKSKPDSTKRIAQRLEVDLTLVSYYMDALEAEGYIEGPKAFDIELGDQHFLAASLTRKGETAVKHPEALLQSPKPSVIENHFYGSVASVANQGTQPFVAGQVNGNPIGQVDTLNQNSGGITQTNSNSPNSNASASDGNNNQVTQSQQIEVPESSLSQAEVVSLLVQLLQAVQVANALPAAEQQKVKQSLDAVKDEVANEEEPDKAFIAKKLERTAKTLKTASETVEAGKTLWQNAKPILVKVAGWLGAAAGSLVILLGSGEQPVANTTGQSVGGLFDAIAENVTAEELVQLPTDSAE